MCLFFPPERPIMLRKPTANKPQATNPTNCPKTPRGNELNKPKHYIPRCPHCRGTHQRVQSNKNIVFQDPSGRFHGNVDGRVVIGRIRFGRVSGRTRVCPTHANKSNGGYPALPPFHMWVGGGSHSTKEASRVENNKLVCVCVCFAGSTMKQ